MRLSPAWLGQVVQLVLPRVIIQLILSWFAENQETKAKMTAKIVYSENQRSEWVEFVGSLFREVSPCVLRFSALTKN